MKNSKFKVGIVLIIGLILFIIDIFIFVNALFSINNHKKLIYSQNANGSSGTYWDYEMSRDDILKETEHYKKRFFLNFGSGYRQVFVFEPIGQGEVTITWKEYHGGGKNPSETYTEKYTVNEKNRISKTFDSRKSDK